MDVVSVLERVATVDVAVVDRGRACSLLADLSRLKCWIASREVAVARRLEELPEVAFVDAVVVEATRESARDAERLVRRAATLALLPRFEKALEAGEIVAAHVDVVTNALDDVPEVRREGFVAEQDGLLDEARRLIPERFSRTVRETVRRVLSTEDAKGRLRRQRMAAAVSWWTNRATGMVRLRGQFDPETGAELVARLESARQQLFPDPKRLPETCPNDPSGREDHLRALTLAQLLLGKDAPGWRPEVLLVIDERTLDGGFHDDSIVDTGIDAELPHDSLRRIAGKGRPVRVTMRNGVVTAVDGRSNLDRGRASRLADLDQRRALRAMYPRCAIPDCPVRFRHCDIHHVRWWEHGFGTDVDNLVPLCSRHHHAVHDRGWTLTLDPATRRLTVTRPDASFTTSPPPYARSP